MFKRSLISVSLLIAGMSTASAAAYGFFDAKSVAMGNVSVATGNTTTAALSNPAMLSINESNDTFALLIPAIGLQAIDNGGMVDLIDELQELEKQTPTAQGVQRLIDISSELNGKNISANIAANTALAYSGDSFSLGFSYQGSGQAGIRYRETVAGNVGTLTEPEGVLEAVGIAVQELGVSVSTNLDIAGMKVAVGVKPKNVQVDLVTNSANIKTVDEGDFVDDATEVDLGSFTSLDAGVAIQVSDSLTIGFVAKNLIEETITNASFAGGKYDFDTHMRAGVSYRNDVLTIAVDMDLSEVDSIAYENPSKMIAAGVEIDLGDIVQLRAGYQTNQASGSTEPDLLSAGVGLWLGFHLDAAVVVGEDSSFGAFIQTGFRF